MGANDTQVGGSHYKTKYEHWDFVLDTGMGYLQGCATKYVARARKKNGLEDLNKALHYIDKLLEVGFVPQPYSVHISTKAAQFAAINGLDSFEALFCSTVAQLRSIEDIRSARESLLWMIQWHTIVPLEDSNKHADRFYEEERAGGKICLECGGVPCKVNPPHRFTIKEKL
jgi:hypothetical protein